MGDGTPTPPGQAPGQAPGEAMGETRHLGLDLGGTYIKWTVLERDADAWPVLGRGTVETDADGGADAVVAQLISVGVEALSAWPGIGSVGLGVPGSYDPHEGRTLFLTNVPGAWEGKPVAELLSTGCPCRRG